MLWFLLGSSVVSARPILLRVKAPARVLQAPVQARTPLGVAALRDDGGVPDALASDGLWSGVCQAPDGGSVGPLTVDDGAGHSWSGSVEWPAGSVADVDVVLDGEGGLSRVDALIDPSVVASTVGGGDLPTGPTSSWAWAVAALGWGLALSAGLARLRRRPRPLATPKSPLGDRLYRIPAGPDAAAAALQLLLTHHRVLLVGTAPVPTGAAVFAPDSADPGDIAAALRALDGLGRPVAVVVIETALDHIDGLRRATAGLPLVLAEPAAPGDATPLLLHG